MDFIVFAALYLTVTAALLFIMLCGESPLFRGTPLPKLHYLVTAGVFDGIEWAVGKFCGQRVAKKLGSVAQLCCNQSNPTLQISYLVLVSGGYYFFEQEIFRLLPNPLVGIHAKWVGTALAGVSLTLFGTACLSDPGTITTDNLAAHAALYPFDEVIWSPKDCWTCTFPRPARSKHCPVCQRCVARFDHHCGWINNCVGLCNMRIFLAFLLSNSAMCLYGSCLAAATLVGELYRYDLQHASILDHATGQVVPFLSRPARVVQWLLVHYPLGVTLTLFLLVACLLLAAFLGHQLWLLKQGRTTYETFRWTELHSVLLDHAEAAALPKGRWQRLKDRVLCRLPKVVIPGNIYNWGFWQNSYDVLFPYRRLAEALAAPAPPAAIPAAAPPPAAGLDPREGAPAAGSTGSPEAGLNYMVDDKNHKAGRGAQTSSGLQRRGRTPVIPDDEPSTEAGTAALGRAAPGGRQRKAK